MDPQEGVEDPFQEAFAQAVDAMNDNEYEQAIEHLGKCLTMREDDPHLFIMRGMANAKLLRKQQALEDYTKAIILAPDLSDAHLARADFYMAYSEYRDALTDMCKAIEVNPTDRVGYIRRGLLFMDLNRYSEAVRDFLHIISQYRPKEIGEDELTSGYWNLENDVYFCLTMTGHSFTQTKDFISAMKYLKQAIALCPKKAQAHYYISLLYDLIGRRARAKKERAIAEKLEQASDELPAPVFGLEVVEGEN